MKRYKFKRVVKSNILRVLKYSDESQDFIKTCCREMFSAKKITPMMTNHVQSAV